MGHDQPDWWDTANPDQIVHIRVATVGLRWRECWQPFWFANNGRSVCVAIDTVPEPTVPDISVACHRQWCDTCRGAPSLASKAASGSLARAGVTTDSREERGSLLVVRASFCQDQRACALTPAWAEIGKKEGIHPMTIQKKSKFAPWLILATAVILGIACFGGLIGAFSGDTEPAASPTATEVDDTPAEREARRQANEKAAQELADALAAAEEREKAEAAAAEAAAAEAKARENQITDGIWTVGEDVKPGKYKVIDPVVDDCYWAILKSGTNGRDIIANDLPSGGRPSVTLRKGQDFETNRCGVWERQG